MAKTNPMAAAAAAADKKHDKTAKGKGKKKGSKIGPAAVAMKARGAAAAAAAAGRNNPFESIWSRRKFDVLGKKRKGEERRVSRSRSDAIHKRENTLLKEFEQSTKSSVFHDRRIGERDEALPEFDKAILRQQREHMAKLKRESKYNLSDEEDDEDDVHHHTLSGKDDFDEEVLLDDGSDEEGKMVLSKKRLSLQSGDFPEETSGPKSKKEVMSEIILKSKFYKAQRAKDKEEDEHLVDKLDSDFALLAQTPALLSLTGSAKMNAGKNKDSFGLTAKETFNKEKPDAYDKLVKEMVMDQRARPSERTKTPEEIAQEEKERLQKLEEKRQKRMLGKAESSDEDDDDDDNGGEGELRMKLDSSKPISGDDLGDSFSLDKSTRKEKGWVDQIYEREGKTIGEGDVESDDEETDGDDETEEEDGEEDSSDNDFGNISAKDWEQSDDDEVAVEEDDMEDVKEKEQEISDKVAKKSVQNSKKLSNAKPDVKDNSIPFVIEAPCNLKDLCSLLDGRSQTEIVEIISHIRTCNSIRLAAENRKKMQVFYGVLLQYFAVLATQSPVRFEIIDTLVKPLIEMSGETPYFAAICARQRLIHTRTRLCEDIKVPGKSCWPSLKTLLLLRLWSLTFPCSDFRHVVATPMLLLMCEYLTRCPIQSGRDVAVGSFLCSMLLVATKESKKFCPEAVVFLQSLLVTSVGNLKPQLRNQFNDQFMELKTMEPWLHIHGEVHEVNPVNFLEIMSMDSDAPYFTSNNFKAGVLLSVVECLRGYVIIHEELCSFPEIFLPISSLLQEILGKSDLPSLLQDMFHEVIDLIKNKTNELLHASREPLRMRKQKPEPIKQLNPKFEENYIKGLNYDPDREKVQMKKLKERLKSEKKGAVRELRKDNYYLAAAKEKERMKQDQERAEKYGKAMAFLQEQESAFKSGQLGKGKKRRR